MIDDGSTDRTRQIADAAGVRVLRLPFNVGIGGAVQAGFTFALENDYDYMVQVDADGQHDAREIRRLHEFLRSEPGVDMVTGSRFLDPCDDNHRSTRSRRAGIRLFAAVLSLVTRQRVTDPTSGFRMTNRRGIELFARDYPHDYPEVEAVLMIHHHRLVSDEFPVRMRERTAGESSIKATHSVVYMLKVLLAIGVGLLRARPNIEPGDASPVTAEHTL